MSLALGLGFSRTSGAANGVYAPPDVTPDAFSFIDVVGAALLSVCTSAPITVTGIDSPVAISVTGGEYAVNGAAFTAGAGVVGPGDQVAARGAASGANSTAVGVTVTIGGVSDTFSITTLAGEGGGAAGQPIGLLLILTKAA